MALLIPLKDIEREAVSPETFHQYQEVHGFVAVDGGLRGQVRLGSAWVRRGRGRRGRGSCFGNEG